MHHDNSETVQSTVAACHELKASSLHKLSGNSCNIPNLSQNSALYLFIFFFNLTKVTTGTPDATDIPAPVFLLNL